MATFAMQALGCEVTAINTVQFSNHTAYKQVKGRKTPAEEVTELYEGLKQSHLDDFDVMLSGYCPSAAVVQEVGKIARESRFKATTKPGSFFWVLDPVMGDNGKIYVNEDVVPAYKALLKDADLILPNQFEAELLSEVKITDYASLATAIETLHRKYRVPHVLITSVTLPPTTTSTPQNQSRASSPFVNSANALQSGKLSIVGSTATSDLKPRLFRLTVPALPVFFSGTGDMFAALMVARLRESCQAADLLTTNHWQSPDDVEATELPLAKAAEKVLASMHAVLVKTMNARSEELKRLDDEAKHELNVGIGEEAGQDKSLQRHLRLTKAAEVRVVRNWRDLVEPQDLNDFRAQVVAVDQ
ncbi:hypothetical protein AAFC00_001686 [Neodothiora populina]|uniref:pyridoxal kinase n=1 Tax=Neodothiora populina TaxID=2781224 RepID=A0ABR3PPT0_9PEZI